MDFHLKEKRVLELGSSSGLGFAVAKAFALEGAHVAICSRYKTRIEKAAKEIPGASPFVCDLDTIGEGKKLVEAVIKTLGGIDILLGTTEEFAALTVFLGSSQAAYITGQAIACDGGRLRGI